MSELLHGVDRQRREWSPAQIEIAEDSRPAVMTEIGLRTAEMRATAR